MIEFMKTPQLAIVIPAYKARYLRETLASVAAQTNKNFKLYIGDDASPEPLAEIVREFSGELPVQYMRFDKNWGRTVLTKHWTRCIRLSNEPI
jgi:glycosyltransferase involved in cell wall biosynthesis